MKLTSVTVRNFRSYTDGDGAPPHKLDLGDGLNVLVGPNNCGKSNLLRAVALALEDTVCVDSAVTDNRPSWMDRAYPVITLSLSSKRTTSVETTLLKYLEDYERSAGAKSTNAATGKIVLRVSYLKSGRHVAFVVKGKATQKGNPDYHEKALAQFKKCVRFIYLRSGEGLSDFLSGTFRELLHIVRQDHLLDELTVAEKLRDEFVGKLKASLLTPLEEHVRAELQRIMPEVESVTIEPCVPTLEDILSRAEIKVKDSADTSLLNKGTGVRGALLVGHLSPPWP